MSVQRWRTCRVLPRPGSIDESAERSDLWVALRAAILARPARGLSLLGLTSRRTFAAMGAHPQTETLRLYLLLARRGSQPDRVAHASVRLDALPGLARLRARMDVGEVLAYVVESWGGDVLVVGDAIDDGLRTVLLARLAAGGPPVCVGDPHAFFSSLDQQTWFDPAIRSADGHGTAGVVDPHAAASASPELAAPSTAAAEPTHEELHAATWDDPRFFDYIAREQAWQNDDETPPGARFLDPRTQSAFVAEAMQTFYAMSRATGAYAGARFTDDQLVAALEGLRHRMKRAERRTLRGAP